MLTHAQRTIVCRSQFYYNTPEKGVTTLISNLAGRKRPAKPVIIPHDSRKSKITLNDPQKSKIKTDAEEELEELQRIAELRRRVKVERMEEAQKRRNVVGSTLSPTFEWVHCIWQYRRIAWPEYIARDSLKESGQG